MGATHYSRQHSSCSRRGTARSEEDQLRYVFKHLSKCNLLIPSGSSLHSDGHCPWILKATNDKLVTVIEDVNMVEFRYPMGALELSADRASSPAHGGEFNRLVQHWDTGYCHAFSKPYILQQWVRATPEWNYDPGAEQAAYDFFLQMFHNVRFADYCRRLSLVAALFRRESHAAGPACNVEGRPRCRQAWSAAYEQRRRCCFGWH